MYPAKLLAISFGMSRHTLNSQHCYLTYLTNQGNFTNMTITQEAKRKKTFPLEIEEDLHKALKFKAIETDMTLHAYIIETLNARVREDSAAYSGKSNGQTANSGDKP